MNGLGGIKWRFVLGLLAVVLAAPAQADWYLDNESSRISFISAKNGRISEVHRFLTLQGKVTEEGLGQLQIDLASVSTAIALRDQRMRTLLFEVASFPLAQVEAQLDLASIRALAPGAQLELRLPLNVTLHGKQQHYASELLVTRLDEHRFQVVTLAPLVVQASDFDLVAGVEALRKVAGLQMINPSAPVSAVLIFTER